MRKDINEETKKRLIPIYEQVEKDFSNFPDIKTTEDFFIWRDKVKNMIELQLRGTIKQNDSSYKKKLRNNIIEDEDGYRYDNRYTQSTFSYDGP